MHDFIFALIEIVDQNRGFENCQLSIYTIYTTLFCNVYYEIICWTSDFWSSTNGSS